MSGLVHNTPLGSPLAATLAARRTGRARPAIAGRPMGGALPRLGIRA
jgi:hypothetical protein